MLATDEAFLQWLETANRDGIARLRNLPDEDDLIHRVLGMIGIARATNFGTSYTLDIQEKPESNAYTSTALVQHMDLPTRESPPGFQLLHCRQNTTDGGEAVYVDGFKVAEVLREEQPDAFEALTQIPLDYRTRASDYDYRAQGPAIGLNRSGEPHEIRLNAWLRAPLRAPLSIQQTAYNAVRVFTEYAQQARFQMIFDYKAGDLLAFDNRRILHGRRAYNAGTGRRFIEGIYSDRDDLHSRIRVLREQLRSE